MELNYDFTKGVDNWPVSIDQTMQLLNGYQAKCVSKQRVVTTESELVYAQHEKSGSKKWKNPDNACHRCSKKALLLACEGGE